MKPIDTSKYTITENGNVIRTDYRRQTMKEVNKMKKEDIIGHPNHYCAGRKYEPKDVIRDWKLNFNLGNAVKYISRNGRKANETALKDLKKARQYLDFEIEALESEAFEKEENNA